MSHDDLIRRLRRHDPHCNSVIDREAERPCNCHRSEISDEAADALAASDRELAEARLNERRYLWLRNRSSSYRIQCYPGIHEGKYHDMIVIDSQHFPSLDAAIDAALAQAREGTT